MSSETYMNDLFSIKMNKGDEILLGTCDTLVGYSELLSNSLFP